MEDSEHQGTDRFFKGRRFRASDGTTIAYAYAAPPAGAPEGKVAIVYVPGLFCTDTYVAPVAQRLLAAGHAALVLDNRGHFDSGLPRHPGLMARGLHEGDVSPARMGRDIVELLDDADVERAAVLGHSLGVQILFEAYRAGGPERIAALVPVAGTFENPVKTFANRDLDSLFTIFERLRPWIPFDVLGPIFGRIASPDLGVKVVRGIRAGGDKVTADVLRPHITRIGELNFAVGFRVVSEMRGHSAADVLPSIEVPVLVCAGDEDVFTPPAVQQVMAERIPGAEIAWFEGGSHFLPVDFAEEVSAAVDEFLGRRVAAGSGREGVPTNV